MIQGMAGREVTSLVALRLQREVIRYLGDWLRG